MTPICLGKQFCMCHEDTMNCHISHRIPKIHQSKLMNFSANVSILTRQFKRFEQQKLEVKLSLSKGRTSSGNLTVSWVQKIFWKSMKQFHFRTDFTTKN